MPVSHALRQERDYRAGYGPCGRSGRSRSSMKFVKLLQAAGVTVRFAIHPVADVCQDKWMFYWRKAGVPYDLIFQLADINPDFATTDVRSSSAPMMSSTRRRGMTKVLRFTVCHPERRQGEAGLRRKEGQGKGYAGIINALFYDEKLQHGLWRRSGRAGADD